MGRLVPPLMVVTLLFLAGAYLPFTAQAPVKSIEITTDRTDYFIGMQVEAKLIVNFTSANPPATEVKFEWFAPGGVEIFNETKNLTLYPIGTTFYGVAYSNWTSNISGIGFRVLSTYIEGDFTDIYFNVHSYEEFAYVTSLSLVLSNTFYQNGTAVTATALLSYTGNGSALDNVSFVWHYPNGSVAFSEKVLPNETAFNSTAEVSSIWTADFVGDGYLVEAVYEGVEPLGDTANFDVVPAIETWKNDSISGDVLWPVSGSPFGVCNNITVYEGSKLTIEAGSVIRFCPGVGLTVRGTLVMEGLPTSKIVLTSYSHPPQKGDWKGVTFEDESDDTGSIITYVEVRYSEHGFVLNLSSPALVDVLIDNSSLSGVELYHSQPSLSGITVSYSQRGVYAFQSTLTLVNSHIYHCADGVVVEESDGVVQGNWIYNNGGRGIWAVASSITIRDNVISGNSGRGIRLESSQNVLIERNNISWSNFTVEGYLSSRLTLSSNTISNGIFAALSFTSSEEVLVVNSTISSSPEHFRVIGSRVTALNCSFNDTLVTVTSGSWLYVENYLHVQVTTVEGSPLANASVTVIVDDVPQLTRPTGTDGWVRWLVVRYETFSGPAAPTYAVIEVNVSLSGYNVTDNPRIVNMSASHTELFEAYPYAVPDGKDEVIQDNQLMIMAILVLLVAILVAIFLAWRARGRRERVEEPAATEAEAPEPPQIELEGGKAYIVAQNGVERSFKTFCSELEKGSKGLCFTRTHPPELAKRYDLSKAKVIWLSRDFRKGGLVPTNLGRIVTEVEEFLQENRGSRNIILLDGLEYLIAQNGFGRVLKFIHGLKDTISVGGGTLLIPFNLQSLDEVEAAKLTADLEVVD